MRRKILKMALIDSEKTHWQAAIETNGQLPDESHLSEHDITRLVTGRKTPTPEQAKALSAVLGCEQAALFPELGTGGAK